ncbi:hypothetical protein B7463_g10608, partial [Scytalidium lignicola]
MYTSTLSVLALVGAGAQVLAQGTLASYASAPAASTIEPTLNTIEASAATATPISPVSNVKGAAFDRIIQIWLENIDYDKGAADANLQFLATQGITLSNYYATTHPSEPNYCAVVGGDTFGMDNDNFNRIPANISTVVDLLDTKGITWGEYQEGLPYAGFQGFNYSNQENFANKYVRKHNPLILYDSVTSNATRLSLIKNFTSFEADLKAQTLPQWSFITPNMTNDGHDTDVTFAGKWARGFLEPLLNNSYFMNNTLIILTFDEDETYTNHNNIFTVLLGGVIPDNLKGTTDSAFYNHYSTISTVSVNWGLPSLGRWDCNANVLELVANKTGYTNAIVNTTNLYFNSSYPGAVSQFEFISGFWPSPNTVAKCASGLGVLDSIVKTWGSSNGTYNYTNPYPYDQLADNNVGGSVTIPSSTAKPSGSATGSAAGATSSKPSGASYVTVSSLSVTLLAGLVAVLLM